MRTYCTRNSNCVGSDIGIGSWNVSIPIQGLAVVYRLERRRGIDSAFMAIAWQLPSAIP